MTSAFNASQRVSLQTVQALHGLAAFLVLAFHACEVARKRLGVGNNKSRGFGHAGVDFLFVFSRFIICYVHWSDIGLPLQVRRYFLKRIFRVCQLYWIITGAIVVVSMVGFLFEGETSISLKRVATSFLFIPQAEKPILGVGWTLNHEIFLPVFRNDNCTANSFRIFRSRGVASWGGNATTRFPVRAEVTWYAFSV